MITGGGKRTPALAGFALSTGLIVLAQPRQRTAPARAPSTPGLG
ncbi:hypothetical protein DB31_0729 [Hyalangium minutum]|uniref:Uncharacterized protein n=1 Tax=Hyalangium minutum TaxID=394096 RepID=A0A085WXQ3_9BACT|nr:hypothetical protein DB31_0729 [Hyalangium minutum]